MLLFQLRQSQAYCTDNECLTLSRCTFLFTSMITIMNHFSYQFLSTNIYLYILADKLIVPGPGNAPNEINDFRMMIFLFAIVGMLLFALRPNSLRQSENGSKTRDSDPVSAANQVFSKYIFLLFNK